AASALARAPIDPAALNERKRAPAFDIGRAGRVERVLGDEVVVLVAPLARDHAGDEIDDAVERDPGLAAHLLGLFAGLRLHEGARGGFGRLAHRHGEIGADADEDEEKQKAHGITRPYARRPRARTSPA